MSFSLEFWYRGDKSTISGIIWRLLRFSDYVEIVEISKVGNDLNLKVLGI
jgi:hypothetical protein